MSAARSAAAGGSAAEWTRRPERGSAALMRLMIRLTFALGWRTGRALLYPITAYFVLVPGASVAASRAYLEAVLGRQATLRDTFRHHLAFATALLDRVHLLAGRLEGYDIRVAGLDALRERVDAGQGCVLLGAHLGSFEALRALADLGCPVRVRPMMYEGNAGRAVEVFDALNPARAADVIRIGVPSALLRVKEALEAGELVALLADRAVRGDRTVAVPFLGRPARLPAGPIMLAAALGAPVFLAFAVRRGGRRYDVEFIPFAERVKVGRAPGRAEAVAALVRRYAAELEARCRAHPYEWFNFYDFWTFPEGGGVAAPRPRAGGAPRDWDARGGGDDRGGDGSAGGGGRDAERVP